MSLELDKAVESLELELRNINLRAIEIKKTINQILLLNGVNPKYSDIESENSGVKSTVESRQFLGKDISEVVKEIMRMRNRKPATAQEILEEMKKGDFGFPSTWAKKFLLKNLAIYLGQRKEDFIWFETNDAKVYALAEEFPDRKKELDRQAKTKEVSQSNEEVIGEETKKQ